MKRAVAFFAAGAERDLQEPRDFVASPDSVAQTERLLDRLEALVADLASSPDRGTHLGNCRPQASGITVRCSSSPTA